MRVFTVINGEKIDRILGGVSLDEAQDMLLPGEWLLEGRFPASEYYIENGKPVPLKTLNIQCEPSLTNGRIQLSEGLPLIIKCLPVGARALLPGMSASREGNTLRLVGTPEDEKSLLEVSAPGYHTVLIRVTWVSLLAARQARCKAVDKEFAVQDALPILFNGSLFDADESSVTALLRWQTQLGQGTSLPAGFVWRDAANKGHPATAEFITALLTAITERNFRFRTVAWNHKSVIQTLPSVSSVTQYDIYEGWN